MPATLTQTTLNGAITDTDESLVVTSAANFPMAGPFVLEIENEKVLVGDVAGTTFSALTRGVEGTGSSVAAHTDGTPVFTQITSELLYNYLASASIWTPASGGFLAATANLFQCLSGATLSAEALAGRLVLAKIFVPVDMAVTKVCFVSAAAATDPDGVEDSYFCLYSSSGTLIAKTAESSAALIDPDGWGPQEFTLTAEGGQSLSLVGGIGVYYYIGYMYGTIVSAPTLFGIPFGDNFLYTTNDGGTDRNPANASSSLSSLHFGLAADTALTSPPSSVTIASMTDSGADFASADFPFLALK